VAALPHLNELADRYKGKVQFISVTDENKEKVTAFLAEHPINGWVGLDTDRSMFKAYGVGGIPMSVLVRRDGVVDAVTYPTSLKPEHLENLLAGKPSGLGQQQRVFVLAGEVPGDDAHDALCHILIRPCKTPGFVMVGGGAGKGPLGANIGFTGVGCTLLEVLSRVYDMPTTRIVVSGKLPEGTYDVVAKLPRTAEKDLNLHLLRAVESTFGLKSLREKREMDVYVVTVAQSGVKTLTPAKVGSRNSSFDVGKGSIDAVGRSVAEVLSVLENAASLPVIDETGLEGKFDVHFKWDADGGAEVLAREAKEQLGLALTRAKRVIEVTVVEVSKSAP